MKNITLLFVLLFSFSAAVGAEEAVAFKNPIFNLPMHSGKATIQLQPDKIKYATDDDQTTECLLQEDNTTNLLYKCVYQLDSGSTFTYYHRFISIGKNKKNSPCIILHNQSKTPEGTYKEGTSINVVNKTNCGPIESSSILQKKYIKN